MIPTLSFWITLIGRLAVEAGLLVALAAAAQPWVATPWRRRGLWQTALLGIALAWSAELGGWRQEVLRHWPESRPKAQVMVRTTMEAMPVFDFAPVAVVPPPVKTSPPITAPKAVWWPLQLWGVGTVLLGLRASGVRLWLLFAASRRSRIADSRVLGRVEALRDRVGLSRVRVVSWPGLRSPIAFGWWTPTIALPTNFTGRFDDEAQEAILAHELAHLSARDPVWLGVADAVLALAWWHPAVWWSRHQLRAACESAADDASALIPGGRVRLAELLVVVGRDLVSPGWTRGLGVAGDGFKSQLARRVTTLLKATHDWRADRSARLGWTRVLALGVTALLVAIPWPGTSAPALTALIQEARANAAESKEKSNSAAAGFVPVIGYSKAYPAPRSTVAEELTNAMGYEVHNPLRYPSATSGPRDPAGSLVYTVQVAGDSPRLIPGVPGFAVQPMPAPSPAAWPGEAWVQGQLDQIVLPEADILQGTVAAALEKLSRLSTKADPKGHGLNLLLVFDDERPPVSTALLPERIQLRHVTLREAVLAVARASTIPVGLMMDERFAYLERTRPGKALGQTLVRRRWWLVETNSFWLMVRSNRPPSAAPPNPLDELRAFFRAQGISFPHAGAGSVSEPNLIGFADSGRLLVSAKASELDQIDRILTPVKMKPTPRAVPTVTSNRTEIEIERVTMAVDRLHLPPPTVRGRDAVDAKLDQIILPKLDLEPMPVREAILDLVAAASRFDPEKRGVDIRLLNDAEFIDLNTGTGIAANPSLRAGISLRDTTLRTALNSIVEASSQPLAWRVDDYAVVVFTPARLHTRQFRLKPDTFVKVLQPFLQAGSTNLQDGVRAFFSTNGVNLGVVNSASPPQTDSSAIFFEPRNGALFVRASLNDLEMTEKILQRHHLGDSAGGLPPGASKTATPSPGPQAESGPTGTLETNFVSENLPERIQKIDARLRELRSRYNEGHPRVREAIAERIALVNGASPGATNRQVKLEVKLVGVREYGSSGLGLDWVFGPTQTNQVAASRGSSIAGEEARNENYRVDSFRTVGEVATINGTQFAALIKRLENDGGNEVLSTPAVLTENGRQSVVSVTEEVSMVDGVRAVPGSATNQAQIQYNTSKVPVGPSVEMLPVFVGDSLRMHVLAKITEFQGYDRPKPGQSVQTTDAKGKKVEGIQPLPHLRVRVAVADPVLQRGETAVLRGPVVTETVRVKDKVPVLGDVPLLGRLFRSESTSTYKKRLYVFVTPTELDAAGNPK